ncbi:MAG: cobyrinate a,c-diamide synthase [Rhodobacterales bacterium]|nr:cobyrinate a,c-diamide synthase [Pseudomonadota bacterium]
MANGSGLILSAPASGSGKTTLTLGILRALKLRGVDVRSAKSGPDYIDPRFHAAASGQACLNLDAWAMTPDRLRALASGPGTLLIEGAMGLFDGAPPSGKGATADLARHLGLPVVLIIDTAKQSQSVAAVAMGFASHQPDVRVVGVILNNTGSDRHEKMLRDALLPTGLPVLGSVRRQAGLAHPSRHLGLVQADERPDLEDFLDHVATIVSQSIDLETLLALASPLPSRDGNGVAMPPPAQRISVAHDAAFAFAYPHLLADWQAAGAEINLFSPLADQAPPPCDLVFLPGGYPELHAGRLSGNAAFLSGLRQAAETGAVYGECGGYMVLGDSLTDAEGRVHTMTGLLRLETSFAARKLHLGYRHLVALGGLWQGELNGHEFHYATTLKAQGQALFNARNAEGETLPDMGLRTGRVSGSFAHVIDRAV